MPSTRRIGADVHVLFHVLKHYRFTLVIATTAVVFLTLLAWFRARKPRLLPGTPYTGLANGSRSLAEARHQYQTHAAEMLKEGYERVCHNIS